MSTLSSSISYEILVHPKGTDGRILPLQLGKGRFAKVYKAIQRSVGRNMRMVALKVLHDHVDHSAERLFRQELDLMRVLADGVSVNVVGLIDIVHIEPSVMCSGCGNIYHPRCPKCGEAFLNRKTLQPPFPSHPALYCESCKFEISAKDVHLHEGLFSPKTKTCCSATVGTILNFVERDALVMELIDSLGDSSQTTIARLVQQRQDAMAHLFAAHSKVMLRPQRFEGPLARITTYVKPDSDQIIAAKILLLEKVGLMQQLAEAIAWLHGEKKIVHKDLAPDNVLVRLLGDESASLHWRGDLQRSLSGRLQSLMNTNPCSLKVIDFGLADKEELSRSWYEEEDVKTVWIKHPYISPEAQRRKEPATGLLFESEPPRCRLPLGLVRSDLSVMKGDILADSSDIAHEYDLEVVDVREEPPGSGNYYAYFNGNPPPMAQNRQIELIRRLGEAHDIYALGGLFLYILTGQDRPVELLKSFVDLLQKSPCDLTLKQVLQHNRAFYEILRNSIPEPFWQDDLMMLILRAMVRGQRHSYVSSRIDRGPQPAQAVLHEISRIYRSIQQEILAAHQIRQLRYAVGAMAAASGAVAAILFAVLR